MTTPTCPNVVCASTFEKLPHPNVGVTIEMAAAAKPHSGMQQVQPTALIDPWTAGAANSVFSEDRSRNQIGLNQPIDRLSLRLVVLAWYAFA